MSKSILFFQHDTNSRHDQCLQNLVMNEGMRGLGIYWCLVEMLHENYGEIELKEINRIAFELHEEYDRITNVIDKYNLFKKTDNVFFSERAKRNIAEIIEISDRAKKSVLVRWDKVKREVNTVVQNKDTVVQNKDTVVQNKDTVVQNKDTVVIQVKEVKEVKERNIYKGAKKNSSEDVIYNWDKTRKDLLSDVVWHETLAGMFKTEVTIVIVELNIFLLAQKADGKTARSKSDLKKHFRNTLNLKIEKNGTAKPRKIGTLNVDEAEREHKRAREFDEQERAKGDKSTD